MNRPWTRFAFDEALAGIAGAGKHGWLFYRRPCYPTGTMAIGSEARSRTTGRLHESARGRIKEYVLAHGLKGGDALPPEGRLAQELGISRTSVREAVKALESLGILEARPGVGLFVRSFSFDPIVDNLGYSLTFDKHRLAELLAVRKQLEAGFVEEVAARATPAQLRVLRSVVDRMGERVALETQTTDFQEEDRFFHRTLYGGLGNELLLKLLDVFWTVYRRLRDQARVEAVDPVRTWEDHRRIVEALERRDRAAARAAIIKHFAGVEGRLEAALPAGGARGRPVGRVRRPMNGERARPNLLLLLADQHRGDCLGIEGHPVLQTPHLDSIGGVGAHFRRAYSESPTCIPARRTLMSGQAPAVQGMVGMTGGVAWDPPHTLAGELTRAGYQTEMIGKLHLFPQRKRYGFQRLQLADSTRGANNDYLRWLDGRFPKDRWAMAHGVTPNGWIGRPSHLPETETHAFWCASQAIEFLETRDPEAPFFLNVSFIDPHPPFAPPQFFYDRYAGKTLPEPVVGDWAPRFDRVTKGLDPEVMLNRRARLDPQTLHYCRAAYYGLINHVDAQVGRLLQYLRDARLLEDTLVLYTADHGEMLGDHHMCSKARAFEPSARVPFLLRAPRSLGLPAGVTVDQPVGLQDVMPTLLDAAGAPVPDSCTGESVLPLIRGEFRGLARLPARRALEAVLGGRIRATTSSTPPRSTSGTPRPAPSCSSTWRRTRRSATTSSPSRTGRHAWRRGAARLVETLRDRPERFVEGERLVAGRPHDYLVPGRNVARPVAGAGRARAPAAAD